MAGTTFDLDSVLTPVQDYEAVAIANQFIEWEMFRNTWMAGRAELRNYLFATDTTTTSNASLPWKNKTTIPKLTQIRDNLIANYMAALFPSEDWLEWEGGTEDDETAKKSKTIRAYMKTKLRQDRAETRILRLICDFVDYGNCFATVEWVDESYTRKPTALDMLGTEIIRGYVGPRIVRISPMDIVFNPTAPDFQQAPKIVKCIKSLGELKKMATKMPPGSDAQRMLDAAISKSVNVRRIVAGVSQGDSFKDEAFQMDGFSSIRDYWGSNNVEVMTFYGDWYNVETGEFIENAEITIMDRSFVISKKQHPGWTASPRIFHAGWRLRPDNLYAMGPLDNLVGMQYRIDHLENLKADVFDMIAYPMPKIKGHVEDFKYMPGTKVICGDEGDVEFLHPPESALNADTQVGELERRMEELAGAPKEAMGIRTPGEKTKFEVQKLDNASSRIFEHRINHFQQTFFELVLNDMLIVSRQNMTGADVARTLDSDVDAAIFQTVTRDDITANGILRPVGAKHFAEKANALQNLVTLSQSPVMANPLVQVHLSGKRQARAIIELAQLEKWHIYEENIGVMEQEETKRLMNTAGEQTDVAAQTPPGLVEGDPASMTGVPVGQ